MRQPHRQHRTRPSARKASRLELTIFFAGLAVAAISGVVAYRIVGLYGDGPFSYGYHRVTDPETGTSLLVQEASGPDGQVIRRVIDRRTLKEVRMNVGGEEVVAHVDGTRVTRVDRDSDGDGRIDVWDYYDEDEQLVKAGFSLLGDGVLDAWAFKDANGEIEKVEVSTRRDGTVDRWEHYENGQLARVEEDTDHDGKVDRLSTYDGGILMATETRD